MFQGWKELRLRNWAPLPVDPKTIEADLGELAVVVTPKKVQRKTLGEDDYQDLKVRFYRLMIEYHTREKDPFELAQHFFAIYSTPCVSDDEPQWREAATPDALHPGAGGEWASPGALRGGEWTPCKGPEVRVAHEEARDHRRVERLPRHLHRHREHEVLRLRELPLALREEAEVAFEAALKLQPTLRPSSSPSPAASTVATSIGTGIRSHTLGSGRSRQMT